MEQGKETTSITISVEARNQLAKVKDMLWGPDSDVTWDGFFRGLMPLLVKVGLQGKWSIVKSILEAQHGVEVVEVDSPPFITYRKVKD